MKYEITKEQLQELAKGNAKVERWFPDVFETKFQEGQWVKNTYTDNLMKENKSLIFISKIRYSNIDGYGFDFNGDWFNEKLDCGNISKYCKSATESEVFEALKKETVKRGFVQDLTVLPLYSDGSKHPTSEILKLPFEYDSIENTLDINNGGYRIFARGQWAEIIKEKTLSKSEAEAKLNELINDGYNYKID